MFYDSNDKQCVEKYSSAVTLSDMEVFLFPELIYALMLANCMSPIVWQWRDDSWFKRIRQMNMHQRIMRLKQFIIEHFEFNLDLDTWGLTTKEAELARFADFIRPETLAQSNALFGYEGDKYYFDIDIRRHFGLDKYNDNVIPYWKTETIEAMSAFRFRDGYTTSAGECVSLATLYAAALFVVAEVPLEKICLMATPLHSQNFIDVQGGILTNNRRIVTKTMWFNGTAISAKARRALEHEQVTVMINNTGYVHSLYEEATMPKNVYEETAEKIRQFLKTDINFEILVNFLRDNPQFQKLFQFSSKQHGKTVYIEAEKVFRYEYKSKSRAGSPSQKALMNEIDRDEWYPDAFRCRIILDELETFFKQHQLSGDRQELKTLLQSQLQHCCEDVEPLIDTLRHFAHVEPRLPGNNGKRWIASKPLQLDISAGREVFIKQVYALRHEYSVADLAVMAYRDMKNADWKPFMKAAFERNPVIFAAANNWGIEELARRLTALPNQSIYADSHRVAQPDEVWNFGRGDGLEKAIALASVIHRRGNNVSVKTAVNDGNRVAVTEYDGQTFVFPSEKETREIE
ncbi:hypothetical protein FACS1894170_08320 [Planctomycetales bacterium]|nr:hypothetical protein FACS1894170_08320 [Planctomycetales bacterium]